MKKLFACILLSACFNAASAQKATLDTVRTDSTIHIFLTDADGRYEVLKSEHGRSYIVKDGQRIFIYRREPKN